MTTLFSGTLTTAATATGNTFQLSRRDPVPAVLYAQANFTYGSGGTNVGVFIQVSLDGGGTWTDIISFTLFTTSTARQVASVTQAAANLAPATAHDGGLTAGTAVNFLGPQLRAKVVSTGTYAGGTTLAVDIYTGYLAPVPNE